MNTQHRHDSAGIIQTRTGESAPAEPGSRRPSRRGLRRAPGLTLTIAFGAALAATGCNDLLNPGDENDPEETLVYEDDYLSGPISVRSEGRAAGDRVHVSGHGYAGEVACGAGRRVGDHRG